jgi:hypothetical protein
MDQSKKPITEGKKIEHWLIEYNKTHQFPKPTKDELWGPPTIN